MYARTKFKRTKLCEHTSLQRYIASVRQAYPCRQQSQSMFDLDHAKYERTAQSSSGRGMY
jgi:hypothetical protein